MIDDSGTSQLSRPESSQPLSGSFWSIWSFLPQARPPLCGAGLVGHISGRISPTGESLLRFLHDGSSSRTLEYWETAGKRIANLQAR
jgi:hypothetical protein